MKLTTLFIIGSAALLVSAAVSRGEIKTVIEYKDNPHASAAFKFKNVPAPSKTDAATKAKFTIVDGRGDENGAGLGALHDGKLPGEEDEPESNFFFDQGTDGGRVLVDLGSAIEIKEVNTYSWHPNTRGPQVYKLYASQGKAEGFNAQPKKGTEPEKCGWKLIAQVDTRPRQGQGGGQYGVSISDSEGTIGTYRYLLFDISRTESDDEFGNTFYSEIDVVGADDAALLEPKGKQSYLFQSPDGRCEISIDASAAPELADWADHKLGPALAEWYPRIVAMLPSEGYTAPPGFSLIIRPGRGVAGTSGTEVTANSTWLKNEIEGQAIGALVHEAVHVVQHYEGGRAPAWLVEGIADYIRWYQYEPQSRGAEVSERGLARAKYNASYRLTANFLNWVTERYDEHIVQQVNAALRQGQYRDELWQQTTGHTVQELGDQWKAGLAKKLADQTTPKS